MTSWLVSRTIDRLGFPVWRSTRIRAGSPHHSRCATISSSTMCSMSTTSSSRWLMRTSPTSLIGIGSGSPTSGTPTTASHTSSAMSVSPTPRTFRPPWRWSWTSSPTPGCTCRKLSTSCQWPTYVAPTTPTHWHPDARWPPGGGSSTSRCRGTRPTAPRPSGFREPDRSFSAM